MKMFIASRFSHKEAIKEIEVERETESCVYINGRRKAKTTDYDWIRATREEAKTCLIEHFENKVRIAKSNLEYTEKDLAEAKSA